LDKDDKIWANNVAVTLLNLKDLLQETEKRASLLHEEINILHAKDWYFILTALYFGIGILLV